MRRALAAFLAALPLLWGAAQAQTPSLVRNLTADIRASWTRKARDLERAQLMPKRSRSSDDIRQPSPFEMYAAHRALSSADTLIANLTRAYGNARQRTMPLVEDARASLPSAVRDRLRDALIHALKESYDIRPAVDRAANFVEMQNAYETAMTGLALLPARTRLFASALRDLHALNAAYREEGKPGPLLAAALKQRLDQAFSLFRERWTISDALTAESRIDAQAVSFARLTYGFLEEMEAVRKPPPRGGGEK
ncbi:MAG: hypothetical protein IT210_09630 [Armatimonadetes bacterium]|nr:hypothetical protein [Armatimonadota bacterium]